MGETSFVKVQEDLEFAIEATRLLGIQAERVEAYRRFLGTFGQTIEPGKTCWDVYPALPVEAFRTDRVWAGESGVDPDYFETSGTTDEVRGRHWFTDLAPYRASVVAGWRRFMPEVEGHAWASLIPSVQDRPHSSLAWMVQILTEEIGSGRAVPVFVDRDFALDVEGFGAWLRESEGRNVLLLATTFAVAAWCEAWRAREGERFRLGAKSVLFETGGFKGRGRELSEDEFLGLLQEVLGLEPNQVWNEYGMTEMFSQGYRRRDELVHRVPPWVRVRMRDPVTGEVCREGERGLIEVVDLANRESVAALATRDVGMMRGDGFVLLGRVVGAEPRGCSLPFGKVR
ncbi:MAG: coenzyme F390 synthetase [Candidatus Methylacidiphilales bacterium]